MPKPGRLLAITMAFTTIAVSAQAARHFPTRYRYYLVSGSSASEVHQQLTRRGPVFEGRHAYASTTITRPQQHLTFDNSGGMCRVKDYSISTGFEINLPQLKNPAALGTSERSSWQSFYAFAKHHEEEHKSIWVSCWSALDAQALYLTDKTCAGLGRKVQALAQSSMAACEKRHEALDRRDQAALENQAFIRLSARR